MSVTRQISMFKTVTQSMTLRFWKRRPVLVALFAVIAIGTTFVLVGATRKRKPAPRRMTSASHRTHHQASSMLSNPSKFSQPGPVLRDHPSGRTRTYYLAAEEVDWNYAPTGSNQITGQPFGDLENTFVANGPDRIGSIYRKAQFVEYTNDSFNERKQIGAKWHHLGILGPVIRAEVGDEIKVVFKNNTTIPTSVHPHGVFYAKDGSEGAPYNDGLPPKLGDAKDAKLAKTQRSSFASLLSLRLCVKHF